MLPFLLAFLAAAPPAAAGAAPPAMQSLMQNCDAHKFETMIDVPAGDGAFKQSRLRLCGNEGQSDADWITTLKDAVAKTQANEQMPASVRAQVAKAIGDEIARLQLQSAATGGGSLPPPRAAVKAAPSEDFAALPPLPDTPPPVVHVLAGTSAALPLLPRPKLSFACFTPGEGAEGPCTDFTRDTMLTVRADEDLPAGTSLRFVRNGREPSDIQLAQLKRGRSLRFALPPDVCRGFTVGSLQIRIVRALAAAGPSGQEVGEEGPFNLRC